MGEATVLLKHLVAPVLVLSIVVAIQPDLLLRTLTFCYIVYSNWSALSTTRGRGPYEDYVLGLVLCLFSFNALHLLFLTKPTEDYHHKSDVHKSPRRLPVHKRLYWAMCSVLNVYGVGWDYRVSSPKLLGDLSDTFSIKDTTHPNGQYFQPLDFLQDCPTKIHCVLRLAGHVSSIHASEPVIFHGDRTLSTSDDSSGLFVNLC